MAKAAGSQARSTLWIGARTHVGLGGSTYCGGGKAPTQEELGPAHACSAVAGAAGAVTAEQLRDCAGVPVDLGGIQQLADARIRESMVLQLGMQAQRPVALGNPAAQQHLGKALVVLVMGSLQPCQRGRDLGLRMAQLGEAGMQFPVGILTPR